jgi:hypothetical protein
VLVGTSDRNEQDVDRPGSDPKLARMCRSIHRLYNIDPPVTTEEVFDSARQYVRKISGTTKPSQANLAAFDRAVQEVAEVSMRLLE